MIKSWLKTMVGVGFLSCTALCAVFVLSSCEEEKEHVHQWGERVAVHEVTCVDEGEYVQVCTTCGEEQTVFEQATDEHCYDRGVCTVCDGLHTQGITYRLNADRTGYMVFAYYGKSKEVYIAHEIEGLPVTAIGGYGFRECTTLTKVVIPDSVTTIEGYTFSECASLENLDIPCSVTTIGEGAFCFTGLKSINVAENNAAYQSIDGNLYTKDGKTLVQYAVGKTATSFSIPSGVTTIGADAFGACASLTEVAIPDGVTTIDSRAFQACTGLTNIIMPNSVTKVEWFAFANCTGLTNIEMSGGLSEIDEFTFAGCTRLSSVTIPDGVWVLQGNSFMNCANLNSVTISQNVGRIWLTAFSGCTSLTNIRVVESNTAYRSIDGNLYTKDGKTLVLYAPGKTQTSFEIPDGVEIIGNRAFAYSQKLTNITIPNSVTTIEAYAFADCTDLQRVYYEGTATEWENMQIDSYENEYFLNATVYYYVENAEDVPTDGENYWHYDGQGNIVVWGKEE